MNTLSRTITATILGDCSTRVALRHRWSTLIVAGRGHELTAAHHLLYLALLGRDWRAAFTPLTNTRKLENGGFFAWSLFPALRSIHSRLAAGLLLAPFDGLVTLEMMQCIRSIVPLISPGMYGPEAYALHTFPFEAYTLDLAPTPSALPGEVHLGRGA